MSTAYAELEHKLKASDNIVESQLKIMSAINLENAKLKAQVEIALSIEGFLAKAERACEPCDLENSGDFCTCFDYEPHKFRTDIKEALQKIKELEK